jgi:hypothetical protein
MKEAGLIDIVTSRHPNLHIWEVVLQSMGYLLPRLYNIVNVESDHYGVRIDIPYRITWGREEFTIVKPQARRLKCEDPSTSKN